MILWAGLIGLGGKEGRLPGVGTASSRCGDRTGVLSGACSDSESSRSFLGGVTSRTVSRAADLRPMREGGLISTTTASIC